jgi:hypothetical protein
MRTTTATSSAVLAAPRTAAMDLLRLTGFGSIWYGLKAVMRYITVLVSMARRQPEAEP